jgi:hypothetical protein
VSISPWNHSGSDSNVILYPHNVFPSSVTGLPGHDIENVVFENINITYSGKADAAVNYFPLDSFHLITEAEKSYPEFSMFGELPVWAMYVRHVKGFKLKNVNFTMAGTDYRSAMLFDDVNVLSLYKMKITGSSSIPVLLLNKVKKLSTKKLELPGLKDSAIKMIDP